MQDSRLAWHIGEILTIATGWLVAPRGYAAVDALEDYLADRPLSVADRLVYAGALRRAILAQYPQFAAFADDVPMPEELIPEWLRRRALEHGEYLPVLRLPAEHPACVREIWPATAAPGCDAAGTAHPSTSDDGDPPARHVYPGHLSGQM